MIHGRFQPFHNGHLDYVLSGFMKCEQLVIGITNPDAVEFIPEETSEHRHKAESNPFSFFQRSEMIKQSLFDEKIDLNQITIIPFHVFHPVQWKYYLPSPAAVTHFMRIFSDWELKKIEWLKEYGFSVIVIDDGVKKIITGTEVRKRMLLNTNWQELVPNGTVRTIEKIRANKI